jgi:hypothetical protein
LDAAVSVERSLDEGMAQVAASRVLPRPWAPRSTEDILIQRKQKYFSCLYQTSHKSPVWSSKSVSGKDGYLRAKPETLLRHLADCDRRGFMVQHDARMMLMDIEHAKDLRDIKVGSELTSRISLDKRFVLGLPVVIFHFVSTGGELLARLTHPAPINFHQSSSEGYAPISGWYGPGAWLAFVLIALSACANTVRSVFFRGTEAGWDMDLLSTVIYTMFSSTDLMRRSLRLLLDPTPKRLQQELPSLMASATAVYSALCISMPVMDILFAVLIPYVRFSTISPAVSLAFKKWGRTAPTIRHMYRTFTLWSVMFLSTFVAMWTFAMALRRIKLVDDEYRSLLETSLILNRGPFWHNHWIEDVVEAAFDMVEVLCTSRYFYTATAIIAFWPCLFCYFTLAFGGTISAYIKFFASTPIIYAAVGIVVLLWYEFAGTILVWTSESILLMIPSMCAMLVSRTSWFPPSGISIREMDQFGALATVLGVFIFRISSFTKKRYLAHRDISKREENVELLPINLKTSSDSEASASDEDEATTLIQSLDHERTHAYRLSRRSRFSSGFHVLQPPPTVYSLPQDRS